VTRTLAVFLLAFRDAPGVTLERVLPEGEFSTTVTFLQGHREVSLPVRPDAVLLVREKETPDEVHALMVEVDRGTEPKNRSTFRQQSSILKKFRGLYELRQAADQLQAELGAADLSVLTVTLTPSRLAILRDYARQIDPRHEGTDIFWFTTADHLSLEDPRRVLFEDIWTTAADAEPGALF
jgi:hypothetical protein